jgi:hypothetical protein
MNEKPEDSTTWASKSVVKISTLRTSSLNFPLQESMYPKTQETPVKNKS